MRIVTTLCLPVLLSTACLDGTAPSAGLYEVRTLDIDGLTRTFVLHVPADVQPRTLLFAFHGAGGTGAGLQLGTDLDDVAAELGAAIVYPEADHFNWAEDCGCINADVVHGVSDTAFVSAIGAAMAAELGTDPTHMLAIGFSQGGLFAHRLACQLSDRFRAVAVVAATMGAGLSERCVPARPVGVLTIVSTVDPVFAWAGGGSGATATLGAEALSAFWAGVNGCSGGQFGTERAGLTHTVYSGCPSGAEVELFGVEGGRHAWVLSGAVDTSAEVARFLGG